MKGVISLTEVSDLKKKALGALGILPPFSPILNRLMATLAGENVSFARLGDLIEKDTVVAGNLLHLVNSALYARRGTVNSVRHALSLLGIDKTRNAVLGMSLAKMWSKVSVPRRWSMGQFNMHSAAVAILSDLLAQKLPVVYPEGAFVAGLFHDLGQLLIATGIPESYERIETRDQEQEVLGFGHAELSAAALEEWNLPEAIQMAVLYHHNPESDPAARGGAMPLSRIVAAANQYVNSTGVSIEETGDPASDDGEALVRLGLSPEEIESTLREFEAEFDVMTQYFRPS